MAIKIFGVEFANVFTAPLHRKLEMLAVLTFFCPFFIGFTSSVLLIKLLFTPYYYISLIYITWLLYDYKTCDQGGRQCKWLRKLKVWKYFRNYFPIKLQKTVDLDPGCNYFFICHPHGINCCGAFLNFCTEATAVSEVFQGLKFHFLTIRSQLFLPLFREYALSLGFCSASKDSINHLLTNSGSSNALVLIVGGARESLEADSSSFNLILKNRKGFIKLALQHGTPLVPTYAFGETDIYTLYKPKPDSWLHRLQHAFTNIFTFSPPLYHGRGIFNYNFGFLPYRKPINVIVGDPLKVPQIDNPTEDEIDEWHSKYVNHLINHFEKYKLQCGLKESDHLNIL